MATQVTEAGKTLRDNAAVRWGILLIISLTMLFAYMFVDVLSPLQAHVGREYGWSSTVFGAYAGSEFFLNVFFFFLIIAGIILDRMGVRFTAILSGTLMVAGALIKVYAFSDVFNSGGFGYDLLNSFAPNFPPSAKMAFVGFAIFGTGCEMAGITVSRAIVKWFEGKEMALAMGIEMAIARLGVAAVMFSSPLLHKQFGTVQAPIIFGAFLLCVGLLLYLVYGVFDRKLDTQMERLHISSGADASDEEPFRLSDLKKVFGNKVFWLIALLCMLYYSAIFPFQRFATNMLESNLGFDTQTAAQVFMLFPFGAMIITPFLGAFLDHKGKGATMLMVGSVLMILCHGIFALYPFGTDTLSTWVAIGAIVLLGISFSLVPAALWPSMPKLMDHKVLGSAYSATFYIQNIGLMTVPLLIGRVLDLTNPGVPAGEPLNYTPVMLIFTSFGVIALLLSATLKAIDKNGGYGLEEPNIKK